MKTENVPMPPWTGKREFKKLSGELALREGLDFQRAVLPILHVIWPAALEAPPRRTLDRVGVDHLVWADESPLPLVVQCKGFVVGEEEVGASQIDQCLKSIATFRSSGLRAMHYVLVHNRDNRSETFRRRVGAALESLVKEGTADSAELLDRTGLLIRAFDRMLDHVRRSFEAKQLSLVDYHAAQGLERVSPLSKVPIRVRELVADQYRLMNQSEPATLLADPTDGLLEKAQLETCVILGEFGLGKTTLALRAVLQGQAVQVLYVPAALLPDTIIGAKDLLQRCVNEDVLLEEFPDEDRPALGLLVRPAIEYLLKRPDNRVVLLIDGLDESATLGRLGGLQAFFNQLWALEVPVILTARTEFWITRTHDFASAFGTVAAGGDRRYAHIHLIELLPWEDDQIQLVVEQNRDTEADPERRARLEQLVSAVADGTYSAFYGDIPRRPLFLRFVLDTVANDGLGKVSRAELMTRWVSRKIRRDMTGPVDIGGRPRLPIAQDVESLETTMRLAWLAMTAAARLMTREVGGVLELESSCSIDEIARADPGLKDLRDPARLGLNSLLLPVPTSAVQESPRFRFAHRAFQEFFLAHAMLASRDPATNRSIPAEILSWMDELRAAGRS